MSPRTLLFVDHAPAIGGAERSLLLLLDGLDPGRWRIHLATTEGELMAHASALGISCHQLEMPRLRRELQSPRLWRDGARQLANLAESIHAQAIYANTVRSAFYSALAARQAGLPFIWQMRDFWLSEERPGLAAADTAGKRILCNSASRVIANSYAVAAQLPCSDKIAVIHNGIDIDQFDPRTDGAPFRAANEIEAGSPVVGMLGRLRPWKGQARFLEMAEQILIACPETRFIIAGGSIFDVEDDYIRELSGLVRDLGIENSVVFTGRLDDVRPALAAMDIVVHPGEAEPFGLVNVEAMAMARPLVAFNHGALPEIVNDGQTGILVPPADTLVLAKAVTDLIKDPQERQRMGSNGRRRVETHFTIQQTAGEIDKLLQEALAEN